MSNRYSNDRNRHGSDRYANDHDRNDRDRQNFLERVMADVASWFDDDDEDKSRTKGERYRGRKESDRFDRESGSNDGYDNVYRSAGQGHAGGSAWQEDDSGRGRGGNRSSSTSWSNDDQDSRRAKPGNRSSSAFGGDYDDEQDDVDTAGSYTSNRGRGPRGYQRSDERIREDISDELQDDDDLDASDIDVLVANGEVTLQGKVKNRRGKHRAENLAARTRGVTDVENKLKISRSSAQQSESTSTETDTSTLS